MSEQIVWSSRLDDRYDVRVTRRAAYEGVLTINDGDEEIYREDVVLDYGAPFGPDVANVAAWVDTCCRVVDARDETELRHRSGSNET